MAVRSGMLNLISELRELSAVGTADFEVGGLTYYTDEQLQGKLDKYARQYSHHRLAENPDNINNVLVYKRYLLPPYRLEEASSGTAVWRVTDALGSAFGTADYSVNYALGELTMAQDTGGSAIYLTAKAFSLNRAAADVWTAKASYYADRYDVKTDNHDLKRSQLIKNANDRARYFANEAAVERVRNGDGMTRVRRVDIN